MLKVIFEWDIHDNLSVRVYLCVSLNNKKQSTLNIEKIFMEEAFQATIFHLSSMCDVLIQPYFSINLINLSMVFYCTFSF